MRCFAREVEQGSPFVVGNMPINQVLHLLPALCGGCPAKGIALFPLMALEFVHQIPEVRRQRELLLRSADWAPRLRGFGWSVAMQWV